MKAIQLQRTGGPEVLQYVEVPSPRPAPNEAVVKLAAAGVNFIDVYHREGRYPAKLPFILGQEGAGTITEIGHEVIGLKVGDRVAYTNVMGSYAEYAVFLPQSWFGFPTVFPSAMRPLPCCKA